MAKYPSRCRGSGGDDRFRRDAVAPGCVGEGRLIQEQRSLSLDSGAFPSCPTPDFRWLPLREPNAALPPRARGMMRCKSPKHGTIC